MSFEIYIKRSVERKRLEEIAEAAKRLKAALEWAGVQDVTPQVLEAWKELDQALLGIVT